MKIPTPLTVGILHYRKTCSMVDDKTGKECDNEPKHCVVLLYKERTACMISCDKCLKEVLEAVGAHKLGIKAEDIIHSQVEAVLDGEGEVIDAFPRSEVN